MLEADKFAGDFAVAVEDRKSTRLNSSHSQISYIAFCLQKKGLTSLQDQVNRLFEGSFTHDRSGHADLATWAPPVDIYETENELVVKADLPDLQDTDSDV